MMEKDKKNYFVVTIDDDGIVTKHAAERVNNTSLIDVITNEDLLEKNIIGIESCVDNNLLGYQDDDINSSVKELIYYDSYGPTRHIANGIFAYQFDFITLYGDEKIKLFENPMADPDNKDIDEYISVFDMDKDYDILWEKDNRSIDSCGRYSDVKEAFNKLCEIGFRDEILHELMLDQFTTRSYVNKKGEVRRLNRVVGKSNNLR